MIDPIQLPILMKAIDFVFEEGRKILKERRDRRKAQESLPKVEPQAEIEPPVQEVAGDVHPAVQLQDNQGLKQELIAAKIDEILWKNHESEVQHLVRLLETYSRNYQLAQEQYAKWGSALVPPIIVNNLNEAEHQVCETLERLEIVLSKVYERDIHPAES